MLGKVDRVAIWIMHAKFRLSVGRSFSNVSRGTPFVAKRNHALDAVHLEAEMIDPLPEMRALDLALGADGYDRQIQMTVRQIGRGAHALDDLQAECMRIEIDEPFHVFSENGQVTDSSHSTTSSCCCIPP